MIDLPSNLLQGIQQGNVVLFLGAGASLGAAHPKNHKIPSANALRDLISDNYLAGELKDRSLAVVAEYAANEQSLPLLQKFVRDLITDFQPSNAHKLVPTFQWHGIVTTNYDLLVERAYEQVSDRVQELIPFVKNGQPVETESKKHTNGLQYLKLHGCINHYLDREIPFVLSTEQFVKYAKHRTRLFNRFQDWGMEFPILFCGYSVSDPNIQTILFDLFDMDRHRPTFFVANKTIPAIEHRYWMSRRIVPIEATFDDFMEALNSAINPTTRRIPVTLGGGATTLRKHYRVTGVNETPLLQSFLTEDVDHVRAGMPIEHADPKEFYKGSEKGWGPIAAELDVRRSVIDSLVVEAILSEETERPGKVDVYLVKGPAGNGKTIVLKRAAWMAATEYDKIVLYLRSSGTLRVDALEELFGYCKDRIFVFVDKAAFKVDELEEAIRSCRDRNVLATFIIAESDAEWNVRCESLEKYVGKEFPVRYLSETEIRDLLVKLEKHDSLGMLAEVDYEARVRAFVERAQRQLLVALHEATLGKTFEQIVFDEYHRVIPNEAQKLYADIATLNRLGVAVRAGLIARISGITFEDFQKRLFRPLEHIIDSYYDKYVGDHVYTTRHEHVASILFSRVFSDPEDRYNQLVFVLNGMNLDYSSDHIAFGQMVRGRVIAETFASYELGRRLYEVAMRVAGEEAFVFQQYGIFEMEHKGGTLQRAESLLNRAVALEPYNKAFQHSMAVLYRRQASEAGNALLRKSLRDRAKSRLAGLTGATAEGTYGFGTAAQIGVDELRELLETRPTGEDKTFDREMLDRAKEVERHISDGLQRNPNSESLLAIESEYLTLVKQHARAENALKRAFETNPRQDWIAARLSRLLTSRGDIDGAKSTLKRCVQENPGSQRAQLELGRLLVRYGSQQERKFAVDHFRRAFTEGDHNYEAQFWYAREKYLLGDRDEAKRIFLRLKGANLPIVMKNEIRGVVMGDDGKPVFYRGDVMKMEEGYLFVRSGELSDSVFVHRSRVRDEDWAKIRNGAHVMFSLGFNMKGATCASLTL